MALPWATDVPPDRLRDAAANLALLGAARVLTKNQSDCQRDAEEVVADFMREMTPEGRVEAARRVAQAQERIYQALQTLRSNEGPITAEDVHRALQY